MDFLELASGAASVAGGGVFGLLGSIGTSWIKGKAQEKDRAHTLTLQDKELEAAQAGHLQTLISARQAMSANGLTASINADHISNLPQWAAGIKALFRPFLTTGLLLACIYLFTLLLEALSGPSILSEAFGRDAIIELIKYTVYSLVFSTATAITWWFGDRAITPSALK
jgi:hypothetical protein